MSYVNLSLLCALIGLLIATLIAFSHIARHSPKKMSEEDREARVRELVENAPYHLLRPDIIVKGAAPVAVGPEICYVIETGGPHDDQNA